MKIELSLSLDYVPNWNAWDGVREVVSNAKDAEVMLDAKMTVEHSGDKLVVENEGTTLPHEALLLGHTTKRDRSDAIGRHAEGLKLGVLALLRAGHAVKIRSGSEVWTPMIERSEKFNADVLKFDIATGRQDVARVRVEVGGVDKETWERMRTRFLFVAKPKLKESIETDNGTLLLGEKYRGAIYLKGIWVQHRAESSFGYDFTDADIDRDRKMISSWDIAWKTGKIWQEAAARRPDLMKTFLDLCEKHVDDVKQVGSFQNWHAAPETVVTAAVDRFVKQYGKTAVPVKNLAESKEIEHLGKHGVIVSESLGALLAKSLGTVDEIKKNLANEVVKQFAWADLSTSEQANLEWAVATLARVRKDIALKMVDVVEFRSETLLGQYKSGRWLLARKELAQAEECLATLIHEWAHQGVGDGDAGHVNAIENAWRDIVAFLRKPTEGSVS